MERLGLSANNAKTALRWSLMIFLLWISSIRSRDVPSPVSLSIESYNLNARLLWKPMNVTTSSGDVHDDDDTVTYTVKYYTMDDDDAYWSWKNMPNCIHINQTSCRITKMSPFQGNEYAVVSEVGNSSSDSSIIIYRPYIKEYLYAPNFTVSVDGTDVTMEIPDPPRAYWSTTLLTDALREDRLTYRIEYWLKEKGKATAQTITRSAELSIVHIHMKKTDNETVCLRIELCGETSFLSAGYSDPVCSVGEKMPEAQTVNSPRHAVFVSVGFVSFVLLCILACGIMFMGKRFMKFINPKENKVIPEALAISMLDRPDLNKHPTDVEVEYVTAFHPEAATNRSDCDVTDANADVSNHLSNNNDYVVVCSTEGDSLSLTGDVVNDVTSNVIDDDPWPRIPSVPKIVIDSEPIELHCAKEISDYVLEVPNSPDSGLDMQNFF